MVDGGTDAGVMRLMGEARVGADSGFPLVGVAAAGTVALPAEPLPRPDAARLEPRHSHFVLVPGSEWGDESPWLARVAGALAGGSPSLTVLVNGGETALEDASLSVASGRPVISVSGSGRAADALAGALRGGTPDGRVGTSPRPGCCGPWISGRAPRRSIEEAALRKGVRGWHRRTLTSNGRRGTWSP